MRRFRKWTALLLAAAFLLTGCASGNGAGNRADGNPASDTGTEENKEKSMGRYLEKEVELPEDAAGMSDYPTAYMQMLDGGELAVIEQFAGLYVSGDKGETWEHKPTPWLKELWDVGWISQIALAPDGAAVVIYAHSEDEGDEGESGEPVEAKESADEESGSVYQYHPEYLYVDPEGNSKALEISVKGDNYLHQVWFGKDSRLYGYDMDGKVYEVNTEDGSLKQLFEIEGLSDYVCFTGKYMVVFGTRDVTIYNMETGNVEEENTVLNDFVLSQVGSNIGANSGSHEVVAAGGEQEDIIYFALESGLYRYVIGGTAVEQIMDGSINSLGDPAMQLEGMAVLPDNEFVILYNQVKLRRYEYDPNIPTVPEEQISIYSLVEDYTIRQAVSLFQKKNPEVYVRYEVGMSGDDAMTSEDAIKNLNTKMMSGSGPDLLVLDGLPAVSYKQKGILSDISGMVSGFTGEDSLFPNLVDACREDGKLYYLPVRFRLPLIGGDKEAVGQVKDLKTLADAAEDLREKNPEGAVLGFHSEYTTLYTLGLVSSGAWLDDKGAIDEKALTEFLTEAKRIYDADIKEMDENELALYREKDNAVWSSPNYLEEAGRYYAMVPNGVLGIAGGGQKLAVGKSYRLDFDYNILSTQAGLDENFGFGLWQGQVADGFMPATMVGICSGSADNALAAEFFRFLYGRELQDMDLSSGYPMNMASLETFAENPRGGGEEAGGISSSSPDGSNYFSFDIKWTTKEDFAKLKEIIGTIKNISSGDAFIERTVCEVGQDVLSGESTAEEAVAQIVKKAAIYLAE